MRTYQSNDISSKSMNMLEEKLGDILPNIWVPDWGKNFPNDKLSTPNVFLMGSYFERIFQDDCWPHQDFYLYVMCSKVRSVLIELFGMAPECVGLINRYRLFKKGLQLREFSLNENSIFFYGGRLSPQKNLEFMIFFIFYLQFFYSEKIKLHLIGNFDSEFHRDRSHCHFIEYHKKVNSIIDSLPWRGKKPVFVLNKNEQDWIQAIPKNGIFLSTSNLISEDFSVCAAQVQAHGIPLLVPNWGGFSDLQGKNVYFYNESMIADSHQELSTISLRAKEFALALIKKNIFNGAKSKSQEFLNESPIAISHTYLKSIANKCINRYGSEIQLLNIGQLQNFVRTHAGQEYLHQIKEIMRREHKSV